MSESNSIICRVAMYLEREMQKMNGAKVYSIEQVSERLKENRIRNSLDKSV
jgi:hypothetical protein